jgi:hypothetical protein
MAYRIAGLASDEFAPLVTLSEEALAARGARRLKAGEGGFPCRVSLEEAEPGESLLLLNYASHYVDGPFRTTYAIYVREAAEASATYVDQVPPMFDRRTLSLRAFDGEGMLRGALLAMPGEADSRIRELLSLPEIASVHAHNAAYGCFLAKIERN